MEEPHLTTEKACNVDAGDFAADPVFLRYPGIVYVPISDMPPVEAALIWLTDKPSASFRAFEQAARDVVGDRFSPPSGPAAAAPPGRWAS